jgi:streptomycin 3"-adenylyltransferase
LLEDTLGADLIGAYLHGSAAAGGLRPHSDIDLLGVTGRCGAQVRALADVIVSEIRRAGERR